MTIFPIEIIVNSHYLPKFAFLHNHNFLNDQTKLTPRIFKSNKVQYTISTRHETSLLHYTFKILTKSLQEYLQNGFINIALSLPARQIRFALMS